MNSRAVLLSLTAAAVAQIPSGYYDPAQGLTGEELQWALHYIIDDHDACSYSYIWTAFFTTDDRDGDKVWDMYSDVPGGTPPYLYTLGDDQGGSASGEGEGYNREHSWPKSWFGDQLPMNTDLFHIVPTDIYVNNRRANYPYAEVGSPTWTSMNGSRLGPSCTAGYTGTAFEPIDGYKGDFARNYFYMATRYKGEDSGWPGSPMTDGAELEPWAVDMLLEWHLNDPVSAKELERNEAVFAIQDNRNPFIDHPEYALLIYDPQAGIEPEDPAAARLICSENPFAGSVVITAACPENYEISILDVSGRILFEAEAAPGAESFSWSRGEPGIYFAVLSSGQGRAMLPLVCLGGR